jgi:hypothetical protein
MIFLTLNLYDKYYYLFVLDVILVLLVVGSFILLFSLVIFDYLVGFLLFLFLHN